MTRIESVATTSSTVPLPTPFVTALRSATTTDTVIVTVRDSDGRVGWGEAPQVWQVTGESIASAATDVSRVAAVRAAVGPDVRVRLDAYWGWSREEAVSVLRALEAADLWRGVRRAARRRRRPRGARLPSTPGLGIEGWAAS